MEYKQFCVVFVAVILSEYQMAMKLVQQQERELTSVAQALDLIWHEVELDLVAIANKILNVHVSSYGDIADKVTSIQNGSIVTFAIDGIEVLEVHVNLENGGTELVFRHVEL